MNLLSEKAVLAELNKVPGWKVKDGILVRTFAFTTFVQAVKFVSDVAVIAERMGHHPDIDVRYNTVKLELTTHDAGGITGRDFEAAVYFSSTYTEHSAVNPRSAV